MELLALLNHHVGDCHARDCDRIKQLADALAEARTRETNAKRKAA